MATNEQRKELRVLVEDTLAELSVPVDGLREDGPLEELGIDSLDVVEASQAVAVHFGVMVVPEDFEGVKTYGDVLRVLEGKLE